MVDLIKDPDCQRAGKHRELEKAEVKKGEEAIQRTIETIRNFTNPFTISDKDRLYSLASGAPVLRSRWTCYKQKLWARLLKLSSSNGYRAESQVASLTQSKRRSSRPWKLVTKRSPSHPHRER